MRTHAGKNAPGSVVAMVESPAPAGRASGRWFGRMKHCGAAPAAPRSLLGPICATLPVHMAAYRPAASHPRTRRWSSLCTGKVAGIGASGRPSGERSRLESREGGKSGLPPARAWFEGHVRASKLRSSTWHHSRGSTSQARQAGRHLHRVGFGFLLQA